MVLSLWLFGVHVLTLSTEVEKTEDETVTRSVGFAAAELAEPYYEPTGNVQARAGL